MSNHSDASGASLRLTDKLGNVAAGDSSEFDALGNNVGLSNPYTPYYEPPPPDGELNTGLGEVPYRGGSGSPIRSTYLVNGLRVTESQFAIWADTASMGGMFGILERNARMSAPRYTVFDVYGLPVYSGTDWGQARQAAFQTETLFVYSVTYESWSLNLSLFSFTERPQAQQPTPLNQKEREEFAKSIGKVNKTIQKERCRTFLEKQLGGAILATISKTLANNQAFSGPRSTDISVVEAGILSPEEVSRLKGIAKSSSPAARSAEYELTRSVAQYFADKNGQGGRTVGAAVGNYNGNPNTTFYREFDSLKILHESLHIATGLGDDDLATKLGVNIKPFGGDSDLSSASINTILKNNGCK